MATIEKRQNKRGAVYVARWRDQRGKDHKKTFQKRKDADAFLAKTMNEVHTGEFITQRDTTFAELSERFLLVKEPQVREKTHAHYKAIVARLDAHFVQMKLRSITKQMVDEYASALRKDCSEALTHKVLVILKAILESAVDWGYLAKNPAKQVKKPKVARPDMAFLTKAEMDALIQATPHAHRALIMVACYSGMRLGEILALAWGDIDFAAGKIYARRTLQKGEFLEPKTAGSKRHVLVPPHVLEELKRHRARQIGKLDENPLDLVFTTATGRPLDGVNVNKRIFKSALKSAKIKDVRFHDLRHSYASMLIEKGFNILFVSRQLGHASAKMTLDRYGHLYPSAEKALIERLSEPGKSRVAV